MHDDDHPLARAYHRLLVWDIMKRPAATRLAERALNPLIGKSIVIYASKPRGAGPVSRPGPPIPGASRPDDAAERAHAIA